MGTQAQQRELWIYLSIVWWLGSVAAWLMAWVSGPASSADDSFLTAAGLIFFGVSVCLRLPVLTVQTPTTLIEDHFVWLLTASANVNWLGCILLHSSSIYAAIPATAIGIALEWWSWNEACKGECLSWVRKKWKELLGGAVALRSSDSDKVIHPSGLVDQALTELPIETDDEVNSVQRTIEDGVDPTGRRYLAGEIAITWSKDQHVQSIVVGFVPAFSGNPEVEFEVNCENCSSELLNCTPVGMRIQLKRSTSSADIEPVSSLSWYARQIDNLESAEVSSSVSLN